MYVGVSVYAYVCLCAGVCACVHLADTTTAMLYL